MKRTMKNKIILVLMALIASMSIAYPVAAACSGSASLACSFSVTYSVSSNTNFLVQSASTSAAFAGARNINNVWPTVRNMTDNSWGNITNQGNVAQTFKASIDLAYTGITLTLSNVPAMTGAITVGTAPLAWPGSSSVPPSGGRVDIFLQANFVNAADGSYTQSMAISV